MRKKKRLDLLIEERALVASRQVARTSIMDGRVLVNGEKITKPGHLVNEDAKIDVSFDPQRKYVSRGGLKLEKALAEFHINVCDRICIDVGASTGGFTDCLLRMHATKVYAVDVGHGQLAWSLRTNPKVVVLEKINVRDLNPTLLYGTDPNKEFASLAVIDVSFISLTKTLAATLSCLDENKAEIIALIKPQFEAGPKKVGKKGVIKEQETHIEVINTVFKFALEIGLYPQTLTFSPIKGPEGNIEFLCLFVRNTNVDKAKLLINDVVKMAHETLLTR